MQYTEGVKILGTTGGPAKVGAHKSFLCVKMIFVYYEKYGTLSIDDIYIIDDI